MTDSVDAITEESGVAGDYSAQPCNFKGVSNTIPNPNSKVG